MVPLVITKIKAVIIYYIYKVQMMSVHLYQHLIFNQYNMHDRAAGIPAS